MNPLVQSSIARLEQLLPLGERRARMPAPLGAMHRRIVEALVWHGLPPSRTELEKAAGALDVDDALQALSAADLVVLGPPRDEGGSRSVVGAYPVTTQRTPHALRVRARCEAPWVWAMCAIDALAVAPVFETEVQVDSRCRISGMPVRVRQQGERVVEVQPATLCVGVRWQAPIGHAAHSLCMEMVFLLDADAARQWHAGALDRHDVYSVDEAMRFGAGFFRPLLAGPWCSSAPGATGRGAQEPRSRLHNPM
ncbi:MAG: hypothetical protein JNL30_06020 [Rubrivivax sp.]|nr:hypothetical protein [Rubrivivax sp.]